ncbi:CHASE3 domain-containing protein [Laspinema sp. A4]|uniref:CHASE3 domain-containing protein n=1 Tax=Laspinema sp. D2d TaxID=2953686 RepID=UPI0021BB4E93|nr:CHASE3 domain-containing protein [Laspinema sp. D2d]MCT7985291.1 CHASE3 domain-containing protein [Laspinema sp. D2d]
MKVQKQQWKLGKILSLGLGTIALLNIVVSAIAYTTNRSLVETMNWVNHTNEVKSNIRLLEKVVIDAETGQRGFIFTGNQDFLEPYNQSLRQEMRVFQDLKKLIQDNPEQTQKLTVINGLIADKFAELDETINLKQNGQNQQLIALVNSGKGKQIMDEIRFQINEMEDTENALLMVRKQRATQAENWMNISIVLGAVILLIIVLLIFRFTQQKIIHPIEAVSLELTAMSSQLASTIEEQETIATQQAASMSQTTATVSELAVSSQYMASQAESTSMQGKQVIALTESGQDAMESSVQEMKILQDNAGKITQQIQILETQTARIGMISNLVSEIAMQTELLALNAAIEAVREGEHGKGFGVVAAEIRKLADQSKNSARQINTLVQEIKNSIHSTTQVTVEGSRKIDQLMQVIQSAAETFETVFTSINTVVLSSQQIAANIKQQDIAIQQITEVVTSINLGASQTAVGFRQTRVSSQQLKDNAKILADLV